MRALSAILVTVAIALLGVACASEVGAGSATLPQGMETQPIPDTEFVLYLYFYSETSLNVARERFLPSDAEVPVDAPDVVPISKVALVLSSFDDFAGTLGFPADLDAQTAYDLYQRRADDDPTLTQLDANAIHVIRGDSLWADGVLADFESGSLVPLSEGRPQAWNLLTNLPASDDDPPLAAGIVSIDNDLVQQLARLVGIGAEGLETAFGIVRVETVAFGIYGSLPAEIPDAMDAAFFSEHDIGVVMVSAASYPGVAVSFLVRSIAGQLDMETMPLGSSNARYKQVDDAHLIIKNRGSLIYTTLAATRDRAEALMLRMMEDAAAE